MIKNYNTYWRYLFVILATFFVCGNAGAQTDKTIDVNNIWYYGGYGDNGLTKGENYNITYTNRTFAVDSWQFLALPFAADKNVLDAAFGADNYELQEFDELDGVTFKFKKMETPSITAVKPYLIKMLTTAVSNPTFSNVTLTATEQNDEVQLGNAETVILRTSLITLGGNEIINNANGNPFYVLYNGSLDAAGWWGDDIDNQISITCAYARSMDGTSVPAISIETSGGSGGGDDPVDPTSLSYKIANQLQLTNAPTVYITLPDIGSATLDNYLYKKGGKGVAYDEAPYRRASIKVVATDDTTSPHYMESFEVDADHLEIKARGNSTALQGVPNAKRAYRLKFAKKDKTTGQNFKHDMINGGYSKRNWALLANVFDHSLIRNALTCELGKIVGMPFNPGYKFVDLVINGDYRGTYQITDHPEVDADRININEDTGWYVEFQGRGDMCDFPMCFQDGGYIMNINNPEPAYTSEMTTRADSAAVETPIINEVKSWFQTTWGNSFNTGFTNPNTGWRAYNDEETLLKWWIITEITGDYDGMMTVKAYREADGKLYWGPVWDKDLAYGNFSSMAAADGTLVLNMSGNGSSVQNRFKDALAKDPKFMAAVKAKMDEMVAAGLKTTLCNKIDELAGIVAQTEALNYQKWGYTRVQGGLEQYHGDVEGYDNHAAYIAQLKAWINARVDYVQAQINAINTEVNTATAFTYDVSTTSSENLTTQRDKLVNVTMTNRSFTANAWNAISLPFSVDETQLKSIFGDNYELKEFVGVDETDATKMLFKTPADNAIVAGMPYLIKPSTTVAAQPVFNNVIIGAVPRGWADSFYYGGESVTYGNYTYVSHLDKNYAANRKVIGSDATTFTDTDGRLYDGSLAFIRILNNAATPTIVFAEDTPPVVRTQLTDLPTIYIDTKDEATINPSSGEWTAAGIQVIDASNKLKAFQYAATDVTAKSKPVFQIRGRGTASWTNAAKKSYRIQFGKDDKDADGNVTVSYKHYLLGNEDNAGVVKKRNWVLMANAGDKTLIRNALTKEIGDAVGLPFTPGYMFVDLVLNGTYVGTYQITEFLEADANRVNVDEDNGLFMQMTGEADTSVGDHIIAGTDYTKPYLTIKNPEIKAAQQEAWNAVFNTDVYNFDAMWAAEDGTGLDKNTLVNWYIANEITGNYETFSSIYAYKDVNDSKLSFGPLWNNETAYDNNASIDMTSTGLMSDAETDATHTGLLTLAGKDAAWKTKLEAFWAKPWFAAAVYSRWQTLYNNGALTTTLTDKVDVLANIVNSTNSSQAKNFTTTADGGAGWTITGQGITDYSKNITNTTYADEVTRLKGYLTTRLPYLDKKFKALTGTMANVQAKIGKGGYGSFAWPNALDFSETGAEVYIGTSYNNGVLQLQKLTDGKVPASTGVILTGDAETMVYPQVLAENIESLSNNILLNTASEEFTVPTTDSYYALATINNQTALYKIKSGIQIPLYKVYLKVDGQQQAPAVVFFGDIDDGTTGIEFNVTDNGNRNENVIYDLSGRRISGTPQKGIYIMNGKKIVVK